jgi:hypothetical protein
MKTSKSCSSNTRRAWLYLGIGLTVVGCGAAPDQGLEQGTGERADLIKNIEVKVDSDGNRVVRTFFQTKEQAARELKARADWNLQRKEGVLASQSEDITFDGGCAWSSLWLYPQINGNGTRCCLSGSGYNYVEPYCTWSEIKSFFPGTGAGAYDGTLANAHNCYEDFHANDDMVNQSYCLNTGPNYVGPDYMSLY